MAKTAEVAKFDGSTEPHWYTQVTQNDLVRIFHVSAADVKAKLSEAGVQPSGWRGKLPLWSIRECAPFLVKPPADIVERVLRMHHNDLPKMLSKEWWYGQNQKLNYLERVGDLWTTKAVVSLCGDAFKTLRLSLMLLNDAVEREAGLEVSQREIISRLLTTALFEMQEKLVDGLKQRRTGSFGKPSAHSEDDAAEGL